MAENGSPDDEVEIVQSVPAVVVLEDPPLKMIRDL